MHLWTLLLITFLSFSVFAQSELEVQLKDARSTPTPTPAPVSRNDGRKTDKENGELSSLGKLSPFEDVAVIQRRYLPKSRRFELFPSLGLIMNQAFFMNYVFSGRFAYHINEVYGLEANVGLISTTERQVTTDLREKRSILTSSIVNPKAYYGLDFRWSPIYGKMGFTNKTIVPFDMYFLGGGGVTQTNQNSSPFTMHLGTGQIFALSKSMAARWDLGWYFYTLENGSFNDMHLTLGMSFFFPGAKYR